MIDWDKAPSDATHAVCLAGEMNAVSWARMEDGRPLMVHGGRGEWFTAPVGLSVSHDLVARPTPRTETDELLDMIRAQKDKAYQMGYAQAVADINQQEEQS